MIKGEADQAGDGRDQWKAIEALEERVAVLEGKDGKPTDREGEIEEILERLECNAISLGELEGRSGDHSEVIAIKQGYIDEDKAEILALLSPPPQSQPTTPDGEAMERDHLAMEKVRKDLPAGMKWVYHDGTLRPMDTGIMSRAVFGDERMFDNPTDAILQAKESE